MPTRAECVQEAAAIIVAGSARARLKPPEQAARDAFYVGGPSVEDLEARFRRIRAERLSRAVA